jgi:septal ring factor EnvC (AmiA/AmiB activator)
MKPKVLLCWLCALFLLAGCGKEAEQARQRAEKELETARAELESARSERANLQNENARLRKDNEDLLRLRNEVHQLRDAQKQLTQQVQTAKSEVQRVQAQAQAAQAQAQAAQAQALAAQAQAQALGSNATPALTLQQQEFARRYGLDPGAVARDGAAPLTGAQVLVNACLNNLRQIDGAKQQWALENRKTAETIPSAQDIGAYLKDGVLPKCPGGGAYTLNAVGAHPACSIPGHALSP